VAGGNKNECVRVSRKKENKRQVVPNKKEKPHRGFSLKRIKRKNEIEPPTLKPYGKKE